MDMKKETIFSEVETANSKQLAVLKANFPQCFDKNGAFIQEKLLEIIRASEVELSKESYSLNWLGKSYARLLANLPPKTLLAEDKTHNQQEENKNSQNLLIKGDNLEVLKHMVNAYAEKVKMIYIDPPYNTGKDGFVYNDDRKFTPEQLSELAGIDLDEATRILDFTVKGSSSHSAWLTFMYPRLYVARELLKDDGIICISIDENEHSNLKILCNEVFGEFNFAGEIVWKNSSKNDQAYISIQHEYLLFYVKSKEHNSGQWSEKKDGLDEIYKAFDGFRKKHGDNWAAIHKDALEWFNQFPASNPITNSKHYNWMDERGIYFPDNISKPANGYYYDIEHPITKKPCKKPAGGWRFIEETMKHKISENRIHFGKDHTVVPNNKTYLKDTEYQSLTSIKFKDGRVASNMLKEIFGQKDIFTNPKDVGLLSEIFKALNIEHRDIVLDFFAGSASTAHAIYNMNCNEEKELKFICIQLPEETKEKSEAYKAGYKNIFEITKARLLKSSEKIKNENPDYRGDLGFKIFETVNDFRTQDESELTLSNHTFFDDVVLTPEQYDTLLTTWCLYDGSLLTTPIEDVDLSGYKAHLCDGRLYLIAPNFTSEALKALLQKLDSDKDFAPNKVVFYGSNFESARQMELNEALKSYANKKSIELDLVVRN
ncbi:site-specific DNA-methyltransferase (plasmid) [Escherichia fergusonii]|uniref:site-specific DNA-methyltransferase (adenine-specific) n=2 Tax=Enterobacteriaceae TaxID=543 RepID=A0A403M844_SHIDY|nr:MULTISPECIES: site-specific DNA-methyltransferase [Escherichia]MLU14902.1 site-specific DNA-methyltransferase [Shigella dysenteriae]EFG1140736.1 site-specific DNA-methyltransferase [Escherichia coli]EFJ8066667.1 site-specific DNA-methyltransferase [Escherichia coli]EFT4605154.1 site-specific DNA-methyltransferase [Escherichia coli]MCI5400294.1 site-specific DNA-methyltransferase [Escherichia coli]